MISTLPNYDANKLEASGEIARAVLRYAGGSLRNEACPSRRQLDVCGGRVHVIGPVGQGAGAGRCLLRGRGVRVPVRTAGGRVTHKCSMSFRASEAS